MILGVHFFGFFYVSLSFSLAGTSETEAPRHTGVGSKSQEKNHLSTIVVLFRAATEGSVSALQLNAHNGLAKNLSPSPFKGLLNNSSTLINQEPKKL